MKQKGEERRYYTNLFRKNIPTVRFVKKLMMPSSKENYVGILFGNFVCVEKLLVISCFDYNFEQSH